MDDTKITIKLVKNHLILTGDTIEKPDTCLGGEIYKIVMIYGVDWFDFSYEKYVTASVKNMEDNLDKKNSRFTSQLKLHLIQVISHS